MTLGLASRRAGALGRDVGAVGVVVRKLLAEHPPEVELAEDAHVVDDLRPTVPTHRSANPFCHGGPEARFGAAKVQDFAVERDAERLVAIADQSCKPTIDADRLDDLQRTYSAVGCSTFRWIARGVRGTTVTL
jgi:hypothetical protein